MQLSPLYIVFSLIKIITPLSTLLSLLLSDKPIKKLFDVVSKEVKEDLEL